MGKIWGSDYPELARRPVSRQEYGCHDFTIWPYTITRYESPSGMAHRGLWQRNTEHSTIATHGEDIDICPVTHLAKSVPFHTV